MGVFCYKKIEPGRRLSQQFVSARAENQISHVPEKFVVALETGNYNALPPSRPHRLAYVRELSSALGLDPRMAIKQFIREGGLNGITKPRFLTGLRLSRFASISMLVRNLTLGLCGALFLAYLGWQVSGILEPPKLIVYAPFEGDTSNDQTITVQGETNPETHLTINGQSVVVNGSGTFETKIDASEGLNTITVSATKKHGKTTTLTRHVVVRPKLTHADATLGP